MINFDEIILANYLNWPQISSVKWTVLGHPTPKLNKIIFSPKPSGAF